MRCLIFFIVCIVHWGFASAQEDPVIAAPDPQIEIATPTPVSPQVDDSSNGNANGNSKAIAKKPLQSNPQIQVNHLKAFKNEKNDEEKILAALEELNQLNLQLLGRDQNEQTVDILLNEKTDLLDQLMVVLRLTNIQTLPEVVSNEQMNFLNSRIAVNEERGNKLAVLRDQAQHAYYTTEQQIRQFLLYLIEANNNYISAADVVEYAQKLLEIDTQKEHALKRPAQAANNQIYRDLEKNYAHLLLVDTSYQDLLNFVVDNPGAIVSTHWFQFITLSSGISFINSFDISRKINRSLSPVKLDVGGILVSLFIVSMVYFSFPVFFNFCNWLVERYVIDDVYSSEEIIYEELRTPVKYLMIFAAIDTATYALLYKTQFRPSLQEISFLIYMLIDVWLVFKTLDCIVLIKIQSISRSNKQLRKELFNLSVKVGKAIVVIIALAIVLNHYGISITAIISTLGIGGFAFALAAKDTLSNLFGGLTVLLDNVFKMGDWIKVEDLEGTVAEVGLRSTTIRTFDNALVTIPNSIISVSSVMNWNRRAVGRRIKMYIGVTYESDMQDIRNAIDDLRTMLIEHPDIANPNHRVDSKKRQFRFSSHADTQGIKSNQLVYMDRYGDYSIDILIYCFSRSVNWDEWLAVKEDVMFKIAEILRKNNLDFAYPTQVRVLRGENPYLAEQDFDQLL